MALTGNFIFYKNNRVALRQVRGSTRNNRVLFLGLNVHHFACSRSGHFIIPKGEGQKCYIDVDEGKLVANCDEEALTGTSHPYFTQKQSRSPQAGPGQHQK